MKNLEWKKLKAESNQEVDSEKSDTLSSHPFLYQFSGAINNKPRSKTSSFPPSRNGNLQPGTSTEAIKCGNDSIASGYSITFTNLIGLYEETLAEDEVLAVCKRLNPNVEVPEVGDLLQHISEMVESDKTEKTITIHENELTRDQLLKKKEFCTVLMNGELAGCDFKWEFSATRSSQIKFYESTTEPFIGCLSLLLQNQTRLIQLLEAKDQEIQDYTLNGAVLSRKSLQTTIFDSKKGALAVQPSTPGVDLLSCLESPEYSEVLEVLRKSKKEKDVFIAPNPPPLMAKSDMDNTKIGTVTLAAGGNSMRKRGRMSASTTASVMKAPKPLQASQRPPQVTSEDKSQKSSQKSQNNSNASQQHDQEKSPGPVKRTRPARASASKNLLKKL